jgi:cytochrome oxidase assembly protein ShyY1
VLRTALRPGLLVLLLVVLLAAAGMSRLGTWQLSRARAHSAEDQQRALDRPPVPLESVLTARQPYPDTAVDRPVAATGRWDAAQQLLVAAHPGEVPVGSRAVPSGDGWWVLVPLVLADGSAVPVVRGWAAAVDAPGTALTGMPAGQVEVTGVLRPSEPSPERAPGDGTGPAPGQLAAVDAGTLVQRWPYPLLTGYLVLTGQDPAGSGTALRPVRVRPDPSGLAWQNLSYAVQWFVFAGFGLFLWWRLVLDSHRTGTGPRGGARSPSRAWARPRESTGSGGTDYPRAVPGSVPPGGGAAPG